MTKRTRLILVKQATQPPPVTTGENTAVFDATIAKAWAKDGTLWRRLLRADEAEGYTYHIDLLTKPLGFALFLRLLTRGSCVILDQQGNRQPVTAGYLLRLFRHWVQDQREVTSLIKTTTEEVAALLPAGRPEAVTLDLQGRPVYLRTDLVFGLRSGGSVGHVAGVLNQLAAFGGAPLFITSDRLPTIQADIETVTVWPDEQWRELPDVRPLAYSRRFYAAALAQLQGMTPSLIYQRYSFNNFAGLKLARARHLPFVLEYNGSEIWVHRHWGNRLSYEALAEQIELTNLRGAHLVVVVSQALQDELVARGIERNKILVNPNGVDPARYSPAVDGAAIRTQYGLQDKLVIGFIGTFGPWHGAEVLAAAFGRLLQAYPAYRERVRLFLIGDGVKMAEVKAQLAHYQALDYAILPGLVPQSQGPSYLAACDLLASPHVPNTDGTPFFGSPTKLFEYMAMGKGIVASALEQIGEILVHGETAWLVPPGDAAALADGLKTLIEQPALHQALGAAARREVVAKYTWRAHTERIITKLQAVMAQER